MDKSSLVMRHEIKKKMKTARVAGRDSDIFCVFRSCRKSSTLFTDTEFNSGEE